LERVGAQRAGLHQHADAVPESGQGGDGADTEARRKRLLGLRVDLAEAHVLMAGGGGLEDRTEGATGRAPGGPEVDEDDAPGVEGGVQVRLGELDDVHAGIVTASGPRREDALAGGCRGGGGTRAARGESAPRGSALRGIELGLQRLPDVRVTRLAE